MSEEKPTVQRAPWEILFNNVFKIAILGAIGYWLFLLQSGQRRLELAQDETLVQMKALGNGLVAARGHIDSTAEIDKRARELMGAELMREIRSTNGQVVSLVDVVGKLAATVVNFTAVTGTKKADGSFSTTIPIEQDRLGSPALTSINLKYDATKPTLTEALAGSKWENHKEVFKVNFAEWRTENDGLRSAVSLRRQVFKDDTSTIPLGKEEIIPLNSVDAFYSKNEVLKLSTPPKYTLFIGGSVDQSTGKKYPSFYLDTKVTRTVGVTTGYVNRGYILGASWSFGKL